MAQAIDAWMLVGFRLLSGAAGLALMVWLVAALAMRATERVLAVAACVEAAREARRQGRAPILRAWLRLGGHVED